jgi:UDP-N-acetylglucosamine 2-epimerase (non-hydrolysing)
MEHQKRKIMTVFGTRPEAIKLAPVIQELERGPHHCFRTVNVSSGQHQHLLQPFIALFRLRLDWDLMVYREGQEPQEILDRVIRKMLPILSLERPDLILVQGDTSTAMAATAAASMMRIPVGHIEAGLRSGDETQPFPEEIYRKQIAKLAAYHFAPTPSNWRNLVDEGIPDSRIFVTGNTIVDSLEYVRQRHKPTAILDRILAETAGLKRIVLTMHRRENLSRLHTMFFELRRFVEANEDVCIVFPMHPNPAVRDAAAVFRGVGRVRLIEPLGYADFIHLMRAAWIVVTDSGGIQEEAPTLGKTVLLCRTKTERPEVLATGIVSSVGDSGVRLVEALENLSDSAPLLQHCRPVPNPFGNGDSARTIVEIIGNLMEGTHERLQQAAFEAIQHERRRVTAAAL